MELTELRFGESPRMAGPDELHVKALAETVAELPPVLVHKATMTVIDGVHRVLAAKSCGLSTIRVRFFEGDERQAFVESVRANVSHGRPLTLAERERAARRILRLHPEWSDRYIAGNTGLSPKTVGSLRYRGTEELPQLDYRVGRDGKVRAVARHRAGEGGVRGGHPAPASGESTRGAHGRTERPFDVWFGATAVRRSAWEPFVDEVAVERLSPVADEARRRASAWQSFADALERRARSNPGRRSG